MHGNGFPRPSWVVCRLPLASQIRHLLANDHARAWEELNPEQSPFDAGM
jgi:hypothetical protein